MYEPSLILSFFAGLVSFLSPCVLPLVPIYIGYLSGPAVMGARLGTSPGGTTTLPTAGARGIVVAHALMFIIGFTFIFAVIMGGLAGAFSLALSSPSNRLILQQVMGVVLVAFGLHSIGVINIPWLNYTRHIDVRGTRNLGYFRSLLVGMAFAFGLGPCTSVQLGLIITMSLYGDGPLQAMLPFLFYAIGLGIPFLLTALAMGQVSSGLKRLTRRAHTLRIGKWTVFEHVNSVSLVSGLLLIVVGLLFVTNQFQVFANMVPKIDVPEV